MSEQLVKIGTRYESTLAAAGLAAPVVFLVVVVLADVGFLAAGLAAALVVVLVAAATGLAGATFWKE